VAHFGESLRQKVNLKCGSKIVSMRESAPIMGKMCDTKGNRKYEASQDFRGIAGVRDGDCAVCAPVIAGFCER
jgi:hypothetical protein